MPNVSKVTQVVGEERSVLTNVMCVPASSPAWDQYFVVEHEFACWLLADLNKRPFKLFLSYSWPYHVLTTNQGGILCDVSTLKMAVLLVCKEKQLSQISLSIILHFNEKHAKALSQKKWFVDNQCPSSFPLLAYTNWIPNSSTKQYHWATDMFYVSIQSESCRLPNNLDMFTHVTNI